MSYTHLSQNERYQIYTMLDLLSVAEIAQRLGRHESTIRRELVRNRGERAQEASSLPKKRKKRYASGASRRGQIPSRRGIEQRSAAVETRKHIGHWEADTVIGATHKGALVTLVERKSGMLLIKKVDFKRPDLVSQAMIDLHTPVK